MSTYYKNKKTGKIVEYPPYECKICGQYKIEFPHDICPICGWEDDSVQNNDHEYWGGANQMTFNQYKKFWKENKDNILKNIKTNPFYAIDLSKKYYKEHFNK